MYGTVAIRKSAPVSEIDTRWRAISIETPIIHSDQLSLIVPTSHVGRQAFPVSAANLWNSLPAHLT